ncbi:hypothetical protein, partial [Salmonella sp. s51228]|uniref:hypothetical protein n=1 Tax=Salmonella sp. s51228 TaxID=3159652 RepID=UPI00397FF99B
SVDCSFSIQKKFIDEKSYPLVWTCFITEHSEDSLRIQYFNSFEMANLNFMSAYSQFVSQTVTISCNSTHDCPKHYEGLDGDVDITKATIEQYDDLTVISVEQAKPHITLPVMTLGESKVHLKQSKLCYGEFIPSQYKE